jgi:ribosomal-protein-alanine N-acetyltransferase
VARLGRTAPLETDRLLLRSWRDEDLEPFAALNADPIVMEHFPSPLSRRESDQFANRIRDELDERGWGLWAVEVRETASFAGFVGLAPVTFVAPFTPAVEIGWRLARDLWGQGFAPEAASAVAAHAFERIGLAEIVSFTSTTNVASQRVMQKIGMRRDPDDDFDHPRLPPGHRLRRHVLYRLTPMDL